MRAASTEEVQELAWREVTLTSCAFYAKRIRLSEEKLVDHVDAARQAGASWTEIGSALGCTHQAAISRFAKRVTKVDIRSKGHPRRRSVRAAHGWKDPKGEQ